MACPALKDFVKDYVRCQVESTDRANPSQRIILKAVIVGLLVFTAVFLLTALISALENGATKLQILIDKILTLGQPERPSNHPRRNIHPRSIPTPPPSRGNEQARIEIFQDCVSILAWPSQGGFVMIENATALDFEFLDINPLNAPMRQDPDREAEDAFAERLLLIGGKWWRHQDRYHLFKQVYPDNFGRVARMKTPDGVKPLTERERRFTAIRWPPTSGLWVSEFEVDSHIYMEYIDADLEPPTACFEPDMMLIRMARTMDEKCALLSQKFHGKYYSDVSEYRELELSNSFMRIINSSIILLKAVRFEYCYELLFKFPVCS